MSLMKQMDGLTEPEGYEQLISTAEQQIIYELTDLINPQNQECECQTRFDTTVVITAR